MADIQMTEEQRNARYQKSCEVKQWLSRVATKVCKKEISEERAYELLEEKCAKDKFWYAHQDPIMGMLEKRLKFQTTPSDALKEVADYANHFVCQFGDRMNVPIWAKTHTRKKLYILMLILGAWGRYFMFASKGVGNVVGVAHKSVQDFVDKVLKERIMQVIEKGERFGAPTKYQLVRESDKTAWQNLGAALGDKNAESTEVHIRCHFHWLFDLRNPMNEPVKKYQQERTSSSYPYVSR